jgi:hypothetical protein
VQDGTTAVLTSAPRPKSAGPGGKAGGKGAPAKPATPAGKGRPGTAAPARPSFPGVGLGLLTGESRPFSAAAGGGAALYGYAENPLRAAERLQAIRDEVFGTGAGAGKKKKGAGGGKNKAAAAGGGATKGKK